MKIAAILALIGTMLIMAYPAYAVGPIEEKPPIEAPQTPSSSNNGGIIALGIVVVGIAIIAANRDRGAVSNDLSTTRPTVRPQLCMAKVNGAIVYVACPD